MTGSLTEKLNQHTGLVTGTFLLIIAVVLGVLGYPWLRQQMQPKAKVVTGLYFYDTQANEIVTLPVDALAPTVRPEQTGSQEATCVWAYRMSCGDCSQAEGQFTGYVMAFTPGYLKAAQASIDGSRKKVWKPGALGMGFMFPPALSVAGGKGVIKQGEVLKIADVPEGGGKIVWRAFLPRDEASEVSKLRARCNGEMPKYCEPN